MTYVIPGRDHMNPDGTNTRQMWLDAGSRGNITLQVVFDEKDPDMKYRIDALQDEMSSDLKSFVAPPKMIKPDLSHSEKDDPASGALNMSDFARTLEALRIHFEKDAVYREQTPSLEKIFEQTIKPYLDQNNLVLQDQVYENGNRIEAVQIEDKRPIKPSHIDSLPFHKRDQYESMEKDIYKTKYFFEKGSLNNYHGAAMVGTRLSVEKYTGKHKSALVTMKTVNDDGKLVDMTPAEFVSACAAGLTTSIGKENADMPAVDLSKPLIIKPKRGS